MGKIEKRMQLSEKQYNLLNEAVQNRVTAQKTYEQSLKHLETVSLLVLDALGLPDKTEGQLDDKTHELIYVENDEQSEEPKPRKRKTRKADSA